MHSPDYNKPLISGHNFHAEILLSLGVGVSTTASLVVGWNYLRVGWVTVLLPCDNGIQIAVITATEVGVEKLSGTPEYALAQRLTGDLEDLFFQYKRFIAIYQGDHTLPVSYRDTGNTYLKKNIEVAICEYFSKALIELKCKIGSNYVHHYHEFALIEQAVVVTQPIRLQNENKPLVLDLNARFATWLAAHNLAKYLNANMATVLSLVKGELDRDRQRCLLAFDESKSSGVLYANASFLRLIGQILTVKKV
jgi:hypothetical protein